MAPERRSPEPLAVVTGALGRLGPVWIEALAGAGAHGRRASTSRRGGRRSSRARRDRPRRARGACASDRRARHARRARQQRRHRPAAGRGRERRDRGRPSTTSARTLDVNLAGTFNAIQVFGAGDGATPGGGSIVNIGSLYASVAPEPALLRPPAGDPPFLKPPAYGASKAGVVQPDAVLRAPLGPARRARQRALARRRRAAARTTEFLAQVLRARAARPDGRAGRPRRPAALPRLGRVALRDGPRAARRRRLHGVSTAVERAHRRATSSAARSGRRAGGETFEKLAPATGEPLVGVARSARADVDAAVAAAARRAARLGARGPSPSAARILRGSPSCSSATATRSPRSSPPRPASRRRTRAARRAPRSSMGYFVAGEGRRFYGKHDDQRGAEPAGDDRPPAARRGRPDHRRQHADRERRLEGRSRRSCAATRRC